MWAWRVWGSEFAKLFQRNFFNEISKNSNSQKFRPAKFLRYTVFHGICMKCIGRSNEILAVTWLHQNDLCSQVQAHKPKLNKLKRRNGSSSYHWSLTKNKLGIHTYATLEILFTLLIKKRSSKKKKSQAIPKSNSPSLKNL